MDVFAEFINKNSCFQLSIFMMIMESLGFGNISSIKALRTLRALRPLRAVSRWEGMRVREQTKERKTNKQREKYIEKNKKYLERNKGIKKRQKERKKTK